MDESEGSGVDIWRRPQTEELVDLHVYLVPSDKWIEKRKLAKRDIIDQAISSGFVRVLPSTTLLELRGDISDQLGSENISETFVFLRSVGRNFTQVKFRQEHELKAKSFLPPYAEEPEIYLKEGGYVLTRSVSLGADVPLSLPSSFTEHPGYRLSEVSPDRPAGGGVDIWPTTQTDDTRAPPCVDAEQVAEEARKRSLSLDRAEEVAARRMASGKAAVLQSKRTAAVPRSVRPPTPRVKERSLGNPPKRRAPPVPKGSTSDSITEIAKEPAEDEEMAVNLAVEKSSERVLNSPPPRQSNQIEHQTANERLEIHIPSATTMMQSRQVSKIQIVVNELRAERRLKEIQRDTFMQKIRELQKKKASSKDQMREEWRKRYMDIKKSTPRLEDHCSKLRQELEKLVKDMLAGIKHSETDSKPHKPSKKTSYKIMIMRHLQEVEDLRRRLQSVTVKLNAETKLRAQAEYEVKRLRQDLLHKKTQVTLTRKQTSFPHTSEQFFISAV